MRGWRGCGWWWWGGVIVEGNDVFELTSHLQSPKLSQPLAEKGIVFPFFPTGVSIIDATAKKQGLLNAELAARERFFTPKNMLFRASGASG